MTLPEINEILQAVPGFAGKVTYYQWPEGKAPPLPFVCYWQTGADNFAADNIVYYSALQIAVELYTQTRTPQTEALIESALTAAGIVYEKQVAYIDTERCYQITYIMEV